MASSEGISKQIRAEATEVWKSLLSATLNGRREKEKGKKYTEEEADQMINEWVVNSGTLKKFLRDFKRATGELYTRFVTNYVNCEFPAKQSNMMNSCRTVFITEWIRQIDDVEIGSAEHEQLIGSIREEEPEEQYEQSGNGDEPREPVIEEIPPERSGGTDTIEQRVGDVVQQPSDNRTVRKSTPYPMMRTRRSANPDDNGDENIRHDTSATYDNQRQREPLERLPSTRLQLQQDRIAPNGDQRQREPLERLPSRRLQLQQDRYQDRNEEVTIDTYSISDDASPIRSIREDESSELLRRLRDLEIRNQQLEQQLRRPRDTPANHTNNAGCCCSPTGIVRMMRRCVTWSA